MLRVQKTFCGVLEPSAASRYSVPTPIPSSAAIRFQPAPCARSWAIRFGSRTRFGRPSTFPFARAFRRPAFTRIGDWQAKIKKVFDLAGISKGLGNAVSHRLRDTFAVELLQAGVPIERVSVLLGHQSVRVTERHYNPWVRSRQEQLEADVASAWKLDPHLNEKKLGTNQVHFAKGRLN